MAITLHAPDPDQDAGITAVCTPGGTATGRYFGWAPRGVPLTSSLTAAGIAVVTLDIPGTGRTSAWVDGDRVTVDRVAALLAGLADSVSAEGRVVIGLGHSLGAWLTVAAQVDRSCFDAVCLLGYAPAWRSVPDDLVLPAPGPQRRAAVIEHLAAHDRDLWGEPYVPFATELRDEPDLYAPVPRGLAADFGSTDSAVRDCAEVGVPVYLGYGSCDVSTPTEEIPRYRNAPSVTSFELAGAGHMHAAAEGCERLWDDIARWAATVRTRPPEGDRP